MQNMKSSLKFLYAEYGIYYFDCNVSCSDSVLELMKEINKYKSVEWCWPDTYSKYSLCNPLYNQQYYLNNTGQTGGTAGVDINVEEAVSPRPFLVQGKDPLLHTAPGLLRNDQIILLSRILICLIH